MRVLVMKFILILTLCTSAKEDDCSAPVWFKCSNGKCIASSWVCDGSDDCGNMDDEKDCSEKISVPDTCLGQFKCVSNDHCIPENWRCDGDVDCSDRSDEMNCGNVTNCTGFRCRDGHCIPKKWHCDKHKDCPDGSDEELCEDGKMCSDSEFICSSGSCLNHTLVCDGKKDCIDGSDEGPHCDLCENKACSQHCKDTPLGTRCYCDDGFALDEKDNKTCRDINECEEDGFCSHTCINTQGSYKCICNSGYELFNRTCIATGAKSNELIFMAEGPNILEIVSNGLDAILKPPRSPFGSGAMITSLSYDSKWERLFISEAHRPAIYVSTVSGVRALVVNRINYPKDIDFDWLSNNLYWVDSSKGTVEVISVINLKRIVLLENLARPVSIALSPYRGDMFVSTIGDENRITMYGMDGQRKRIIHSVQGVPLSLVLHPTETILYWTDSRAGMIMYVNYTGSSSPWILKSGINGVMSVAVNEDTVYWTAKEMTNPVVAGKIFVNKLSDQIDQTAWKSIVLSKRKQFSGKSECLIDNGGCSYLCLTSQTGRTCSCSSEMTLASDGKMCLGKTCEKGDFSCSDGECIPSKRKCDGSIECNDGSDELKCTEPKLKN